MNTVSKFFVFISCVIILSSCSEPNFRMLESNQKTDILIEGRYWRGLFARKGGFELKLTNNSAHNYTNCVLWLDKKYKHPLDGLYSKEKGLLKDSVFRRGDSLTLSFSGDISNMYFFNPENEEGTIPRIIGLTCDSCNIEWEMK